MQFVSSLSWNFSTSFFSSVKSDKDLPNDLSKSSWSRPWIDSQSCPWNFAQQLWTSKMNYCTTLDSIVKRFTFLSKYFSSKNVVGRSQWLAISVKDQGTCFENVYKLLILRDLKFSLLNKMHTFQCIGKIFCVEFQRYPLKFRTKYLPHIMEDMIFIEQ